MTGLLLLVMAQTASVQEIPIEDRIAAFLRGDDAARAELLKLGAYAIRPLQKAREKGPQKIDTLVRELKLAAAYPGPVRLEERFSDKMGMVNNREWTELGLLVDSFHNRGIPIYPDQFDVARLTPTRMAVFNTVTPIDLLEVFSRETGLDYGFFHNTVVIGLPERLWPVKAPPKIPDLDAAGLARARELVEKLNDDSIEVRESATKDLHAIGPPVIAVLEANLKRKEADIVARCTALIARLTPRYRGAFGPPGADRQKRSDAEERTLKRLQSMKVSLGFDKAPLSDVAAYAGAFAGLPIEIEGDAGKASVTIQGRDQRLIDFLCLITQARDLDFMIRNGKILVDTREAIEKLVAGKK